MVARASARLSALLLLLAAPAASRVIAGDWIAVTVTDVECSPLSYGGVGDGVANDTVPVQKAIDACVAARGTAVIDAGRTFKTWALTVSGAKGFALRVDGTLRFANDTRTWPARYGYCIAVSSSSFVAVHGSGVVDGNGAAWWPTPDAFRPGLLHVEGGTDLLVRDTTIVNSPNHNLQLYASAFEVVIATILASPQCPEVGPGVCAHNP